MKIIASDFDGTIYKHEIVSERDREAVREWQKKGNLFGIVTGRDRGIIARAADFGLLLDYAVCLNGAVLIDAAGNTLYEAFADKSMAEKIPSFVEQFRPQHRGYSYSYHNNIETGNPDDIKGVCQLSFLFETDERANEVTKKLNEEFGDIMVSYANGRNINTVKAGISKATGIEHFASLKGAAKNDIWVVGDSYNDLPMLTAFDGYIVSSACEGMKKLIDNACDDICDLTEIAEKQRIL